MRDKPNLLFLFTDQQRYDTLKAYGNSRIHTPNLNALAEQSAVFKQAYVTQPVCTPSRGSIMTGLYPHTHGCIKNNTLLPDDTPTLPDMLDRDYSTGYVGKWHLGDEIKPRKGFDMWASIDDEYRGSLFDKSYRDKHCTYYHWLRERGFQPDGCEDDGYQFFSRSFCSRLPERYSKPAFVAEEAERFIQANRDRPFALYVNFFEPHNPFNSAYDDMYDPEEVGVSEGFHDEFAEGTPAYYRVRRQHYVDGYSEERIRSETDWKRIRARYWGLISLVDNCVGRILEAVKRNGLDDDTIVVFTSDHGEMMGDFRLLYKSVPYESAVRVPLLIRVPGVTDGGRILEGPVSLVDLLPTLVELMGQQAAPHVQGDSLALAVCGEAPLPRRDVVIEWNAGGPDPMRSDVSERTMVTPDGWKLTLNEKGIHQLYQLIEDPRETVNLAFHPDYQHTFNEIRNRILQWQERTGDTLRL